MKDFRAKPIDILLVEDNEGDVLLAQEAFKKAKLSNKIYVTKDGEEAIDFLYKKGDFTDAIKPDIILLDINLPKIDGIQVLEKIKNDPILKLIPVVILTSSKAERDIVKSYNLHANSYIVKPVSLDNFMDIVQVIENFWFTVVAFPTDDQIEGVLNADKDKG
jgi:CheY-like chemotaxis protein